MHQEHDLPDNLPPPPPAYSEQEFEQKTSRATDLSLQSALDAANLQTDEDGWETYDEAAFEAISSKLASMELRQNYGQSSSSSSSQLPVLSTSTSHAKRKSTEKVSLSESGLAAVNPLRIEKKGAPSYGQSFQGSSSVSHGGPSKAIRNEPEPPPAFTAEPGPDESEVNWSRPSSASSSALSPIDSQLFSVAQPAPLLSHDLSSQSNHGQPEPVNVTQPTYQEQSAVSSQGNNQSNHQPGGPLQTAAQQHSSVYPQPSNLQPNYEYAPLPHNVSPQPTYQQPVSRPLPPTTNQTVQPIYQQPSQFSNPSPQPTYQQPTPPTHSGYQRPSMPHIPGHQPAYTSYAQPSFSGSPRVRPTLTTSSSPPSQLSSPQGFRNSVSLHPNLPSSNMHRQSALYPTNNDMNISTPQPTRLSLPTPPRPQPSVPPQSLHNTNVAQVHHAPAPASRLPFNPSLAYGNTFSQSAVRPASTMFTQRPEPTRNAVSNIQYNPHELYNNAISSHLTNFSPRTSSSSQITSTSMGGTTPQQPTLGPSTLNDTYNPYSAQSIQGSTASQNPSAFSQRTSTYWPNTNMAATQNFQPQYNSNQNSWSGQPGAMNAGAPLMAQSHNNPQWYSYPSG
ncbi:hypothetical protein BJ165DRAFT_1421701 [Panaeolus papilionaceus]|nr:hypothetical protein BJ165DRAFT_1421701 [Panaeolus papilionaceus]